MLDVLFGVGVFLAIINGFVALIGTVMINCEDSSTPSILLQSYLWLLLDDCDINFAGKLILCVLTIPFTVFYTAVMLIYYIVFFVCFNVWQLFCWAFRKK